METDGLILNIRKNSGQISHTNIKAKIIGGTWKSKRKVFEKLRKKRKHDDYETKKNESKDFDKKKPDSEKVTFDKEILKEEVQKDKKTKITVKKKIEDLKPFTTSLFTSNQKNFFLKATTTVNDKNVVPSNAPLNDATTFNQLGINKKLESFLNEVYNITSPTAIQKLVIPSFLDSTNNMFIRSQTGSGKTLSFLLPIYNCLMSEDYKKMNRTFGIVAVILTPTRELALQTYKIMESIMRCCHNIIPGIILGGEKKKSEKARIRKGINILVATPGRLADHIENTSVLDLSQVRWLILDEGDRLVEMGFEKTIIKITDSIKAKCNLKASFNDFNFLPKKLINVLCSATILNDLQKLGSDLLIDPLILDSNVNNSQSNNNDVSSSVEKCLFKSPDQLVQNVVVVPLKLKLVLLASYLIETSNRCERENIKMKTIVFFSCTESVNFYFRLFTINFNQSDFSNDNSEDLVESESHVLGKKTKIHKFHGSLSQETRKLTLNQYLNEKNFNHLIMFCTDVASRGLDFSSNLNVIEYDPAISIDDHLHRVGRSARVGRKGEAVLFLNPGCEENYLNDKLRLIHQDKKMLRVISYETILKKAFCENNNDIIKKKSSLTDDNTWVESATKLQIKFEEEILNNVSLHLQSVKAYKSHIRSYTTHKSNEKKYFNVKLLHLGHLAKSFGLRIAPKDLADVEEKNKSNKKKDTLKYKLTKLQKLNRHSKDNNSIVDSRLIS